MENIGYLKMLYSIENVLTLSANIVLLIIYRNFHCSNKFQSALQNSLADFLVKCALRQAVFGHSKFNFTETEQRNIYLFIGDDLGHFKQSV